MKKQDLVRDVARRTGQTDAAAAAAVAAVFAALHEALAAGVEVPIAGFGSFRVVERVPRSGRNPQTGEPIEIGARRSPVFRAGSRLKAAVAAADGASLVPRGTDPQPGAVVRTPEAPTSFAGGGDLLAIENRPPSADTVGR